jgi:hypothetical protein
MEFLQTSLETNFMSGLEEAKNMIMYTEWVIIMHHSIINSISQCSKREFKRIQPVPLESLAGRPQV